MAFEGSRRFELVSKLGEGGMGIVYEAFDRERNMRVALKTLRKLDASSLYRFKREFRALSNLSHPNIVALYELVSDGDDWFLTMEMVGGTDFLDYVRGAGREDTQTSSTPGPTGDTNADTHDTRTVDTVVSIDPVRARPAPHPRLDGGATATASPPVDFERLRDALTQLAGALEALHRAGLVHRDLKPSNVRVTLEGRVVLMDFGIVAEAVRAGAPHEETRVVGTPSYMAPEQAAGDPTTAAADWYAFGVMMYVALTGRLPFRGPREQVMLAKLERDPPPPSELADVPADLEALCLALLARKPSRRPSGARVVRQLGGSPATDPVEPATVTGTHVFVGRDAELEALRDAYTTALGWDSVAVFVRGPSGMGKSTLVRHFLGELGAVTEAADRPLILRGRCHERESLSYKAFDGVVDALSHVLLDTDARRVASLLPDDIDLLTRLFPVLRRIPGVQVARPVGGGDPIQLRARAIGVLRQLLANIAGWRPVVIWIDDLQWAGADSLDLLDDILRRPAPRRLMVIASLRSEPGADVGSAEKLRRLSGEIASRIQYRQIEVGPLSSEEQLMLVTRLLGTASVVFGDRFWAQSEGSPLLLAELARYLESSPDGISGGHTPTLAEVLGRRIDELPDGPRALLECIAVCGEPTPLWLLAEAVDLSGEERERASAVLRVTSMARIARPGHEPWMTAYHDKVREIAAGRLDEARRRELHRRIAHALERWDHATVDALARHWLAAGDAIAASTYLVRAAAKAAEKLAFDRAAQLYRAALELSTDLAARVALQRELGDVLVLAGRCFEAAEVFTAAAEAVSGDDALELHRRAADNLLRSGHVAEGLARLSDVMDELGAPFARTRRRALISLLFQRVRLKARGLSYTPRTESEIASRDLARLDTLYAASTTLGMIDHIRGSAVQLRHLMTALRHGEERRVCRALAIESAYLGAVGGRAGRRGEALARDIILQARRLNDPYLVGIAYFGMGTVCFFGGRMAAAAQAFGEGVDTFGGQVVGAHWEAITARYFYCLALINTGDFSGVSAIVEDAMDVAERRNDVYATNLFGCEPNVFRMIFADRVDGAFDQLDAIEASWPDKPYYIAHYQVMLARSIAYLYRGDGAAAARELDEHLPHLKSIMITRMPMMMCEVWAYRARAAVLMNDEAEARVAADRLERTKMPMAGGLGKAIRAALCHASGNTTGAQRLLTAAIDELAAADVTHMKVACEHRLGALLGGDQGDRLTQSALAWMTEQGVANPARMMAFLTPGF